MIRRALELLAGLGAVRLAVLAAVAVLAPRPAPEALMPAHEGALTELAVQFHRLDGERFLAVYGQLLPALDAQTRVHVVVADAEDEAIFRAAAATWPRAPTLSFAHTERPITSWMRDRLAVLSSADGTALLAPQAPMRGPEARVHDWTTPWTLAHHLGLDVRAARYRFDGGDLIADAERAYVASPVFARNPQLTGPSVRALLEDDLGKPVLVLDPAPDHHIGMFLTPLGDGRVLLGDPALAAELLPDGGDLLVGGAPLGAPDPALLAELAGLRAQLEAEGIEVVPIPLRPTDQRYAWLSYNNALVEIRDGQRHVYLPVYGVEALDAAAVHIWEAQGADVHPVDVSGLFRLGGSVRCLTAPIARR